MRIIKTSQYVKVSNATSVPIQFQEEEVLEGVYVSVTGEAYVSPIQTPRGGYAPDDGVQGGDFIEHGEYEVTFYDAQGAPLQLDDGNRPVPVGNSRTYQFSDLPPLMKKIVGDLIVEYAQNSDGIERLPPGYDQYSDPDYVYESQRDME